jgi:hypothetical protein
MISRDAKQQRGRQLDYIPDIVIVEVNFLVSQLRFRVDRALKGETARLS